MIEENNPWLAVLPSAGDDSIPNLASANRSHDDLRARLDQIEIAIALDGIHERVRYTDGDVEIVHLCLQQLLLDVRKFFVRVGTGVGESVPQSAVLGVEFLLA